MRQRKKFAKTAKCSSILIATLGKNGIPCEESDGNFAQRSRYLLKFSQKQYSFKKFIAEAALLSSKLAFEVVAFC
jgi:hypothetical protein